MFGSLFGPKNPTKDWQRDTDLRLEFDLDQASLNGVKLGDEPDRLSFLGPVEDRSGLLSGEYLYFSLGLLVGCCRDKSTIDCFGLFQNDKLSPQFRAYSGSIHYRGQDIVLARLDEEAFSTIRGVPYWRDADEDEVILFYEFSNLEWQVEFSLDGSFNSITVTSDPLLANADQRKAYGVTNPWPPR